MELPSNLLPDEASPVWMNKGDDAGQLTAATLVGLQSSQALRVCYSSLRGVAGFTAAYWVGPRIDKEREMFPPNNIILMLAGAGFALDGVEWIQRWIGPFAVSTISSLAVLNTHVCTATSLLTWLLLDTCFFGKPSVIGVVQGMITGLVCITPAAGVVQCWAAILMGIVSGSVPWYTMMILHKKVKFLRLVDDPIAIFHTHAIAGGLGGILTGFFAVPKLCRLFYMVVRLGKMHRLRIWTPK
uniref:Ammonium transporter AmtB-like domain-containing protein n=1 Tax=Populus alba TaxID=43335 RepID=A0A4U5MNZ2_POPAL|nr:hypothetical protein D5086_0000302480 [Populus alba]